MAVTALVVVPVALCTRRARTVAVALAALAVGSLPWLIPSFLHAVYADPGGVAAFAARADTPFGTLGSLVMLGGTWNATTVPKAYGGPWSAVWLAVVLAASAGYALLGRRRWPRSQWLGLAAGALAGLLIASIGVTGAGRALLRGAIGFWPGFAILRDGQQFTAPLALAEAARVRTRRGLEHAAGIVRHEKNHRTTRRQAPGAGPVRRSGPGPQRVRAARPGTAAARAGLGSGRAAAPGLVPRRLPGRGARDRCQPGPR